MRISRLAVTLAVAGVVVVAAGTVVALRTRSHQPAPPAVQAGPPLRDLAAQHGLRIGTAVDTTALANDARYADLTAAQFSTVTPENAMKWELVEPTRGGYDWAAADRLVDFAQAHGQLVRGHTLVWYSQLPTWLTTGTFTPDELRTLLHQHITDEVTHFRGKIWQWDVVNEAFNDNGTLRQSIWSTNLGPGYIADAFRWAHEADPDALLFYNDYNIEGGGVKSDAVYALVSQLKAEGVPIQGVGFQGHLDTQYAVSPDLAQNMARFAALGLKVAITEADVRSVLPMDDTTTQLQARGYSALLRTCLGIPQCLSFTVWGFSDRYQWVPQYFPGEGSAALYDQNLNPKPVVQSLRDDLSAAGIAART